MWSLWMDVTDEWTAAMRQDLLGDESLNVQYRVAESGFLSKNGFCGSAGRGFLSEQQRFNTSGSFWKWLGSENNLI